VKYNCAALQLCWRAHLAIITPPIPPLCGAGQECRHKKTPPEGEACLLSSESKLCALYGALDMVVVIVLMSALDEVVQVLTCWILVSAFE